MTYFLIILPVLIPFLMGFFGLPWWWSAIFAALGIIGWLGWMRAERTAYPFQAAVAVVVLGAGVCSAAWWLGRMLSNSIFYGL